MVSSRGIFVSKELKSRPALGKLGSCWQISSAKWNESMTVYSSAVADVKNFSKNFANLYVGVPIAERKGQKGGSPLRVSLWISSNPYKMPGPEPTGFILL